MTEIDDFVSAIDRFLRRHKMAPRAFGQLALNDPGFVFDMRAGIRSPTARTMAKVREFMRSEKERRKAEQQAGAA